MKRLAASLVALAILLTLQAPASAVSTPKLTDLAVNSGLNIITALMDGGYLEGFTGSQPATADTAVTTQTCLFSVTFANPAFGAAVAGVATANPITSDSDANASGTVTWFRAYKSDHTVCNDATGTRVWDGNVGTSGANLVLPTVAIVQHGVVQVTSFVLTLSKG